MRQILALAVMFTFVLSSAVAQTPPSYFPPRDKCEIAQEKFDAYSQALSGSKGNSSYGSKVSASNSCARRDSELDEDDSEFSCADINENCPNLYLESDDRIRRLKEESRKDAKELDKELADERKDQMDLKKEIAELAKDYAEKEDELNSDIVTAEKEYKDDLKEKDKEALQQIHDIQKTIQEIADENRKIVLAANRAMPDLAKAKLNARSACRDQARKDYQATLERLTAELAKRGGKIGGGFEGIQNAENYRKFLLSKIKNPEPSEQFSLCYSAGDAMENNLQQNNMNGALSMNEFSSQIEENNKKRDQLTKQLEQQQQLANQQKIEGFQEHQKSIMALQKKILTNRQNWERESRALAEKQRQLEARIMKLRLDFEESSRQAKNAEARYNCLDRKGLLSSDNKDSRSTAKTLDSAEWSLAAACGPSNDCDPCIKYREMQNNSSGRSNSSGPAPKSTR